MAAAPFVRVLFAAAPVASFGAFFVGAAHAQDAPAQEIQPAAEATVVIFNTLLFLMSGMVVMFMAAGFCMLEAGMVRAKNAATICLKNLSLYAVAGLMVWLLGYNMIYGIEPGGLLAPFAFFYQGDDGDPAGLGYGAYSDWFFQMVFVATAASIVSGALAERIKLFPFLIFVAILTGIVYPIVASWEWGKGYLDAEWDFADFAGSTLVHSTGGWAALAGAVVLGPRAGKYEGGRVHPIPGSSLPLATLGAFILWLGWFGFNGGSQLAFGSIEDAFSVAKIVVNTNMAACGGVVAALLMTRFSYGKVDLTIVMNSAIGGLVAITAQPLEPAIWQAVLIGAMGGVIVTVTVPLLDRARIDDVVGAIPAHLFCGIWGTLIVPWTEDGPTFLGQFVGVVMVGAFVTAISFLLWAVLRFTIGVRAEPEHETLGLDKSELGLEAYPEFAKG
ncbi:MAG: ammonium transporter [Pseudomonadota bacterium]